MMQATTGQMPELVQGGRLKICCVRTRGFESRSVHGHEQPVARAPSGRKTLTLWPGVREVEGDRFKFYCSKERVGSNPTPATTMDNRS